MQRRSNQALNGDHRLVVGGEGVDVLPADAEECPLGVEQLQRPDLALPKGFLSRLEGGTRARFDVIANSQDLNVRRIERLMSSDEIGPHPDLGGLPQGPGLGLPEPRFEDAALVAVEERQGNRHAGCESRLVAALQELRSGEERHVGYTIGAGQAEHSTPKGQLGRPAGEVRVVLKPAGKLLYRRRGPDPVQLADRPVEARRDGAPVGGEPVAGRIKRYAGALG